MRVRRQILAALAMLGTGCASPIEDPGAAFVGTYSANVHVTLITPTDMRMAVYDNTQPISVTLGATANVLINDGMCVLPGNAVSATRLQLVQIARCDRMTSDGLRVMLQIISGEATLTGPNLHVTVRGNFMGTAPDGGMSSGAGIRFELEITGVKL